MEEMGRTLGNECQAEGVGVILGPAVNIKRSPLCGRNFEYYSEDPFLAAEMAGAFIKGVQSKNVGTSLKHFFANNQETRRMSSSSEMDERTMREIYLAAFEGAAVKQKPWTVMCSYNRINGVYAAENRMALTDILRNEWGFDGYVVSDWGAVNRRVPDLAAGLDLEMPYSGGENDRSIAEAVRNGTISEEILDTAVERILNIIFRCEENRDMNAVFDRDLDHEKAGKTAEETIVLLKNENVLPILKSKKVAFIGKYAREPRYQGGGSSHINSHRVTSAVEAAEGKYDIVYAQGFRDDIDLTDDKLLNEAIRAAKSADTAVIFAGLPDAFESEGFDRTHIRMPDCQNILIDRICEVQPNVIVVLHNGSPVEMPWKEKVSGIIEAYLGGQAVGKAVADILFGDVNPSGRLPETFPLRLEDNPSYLYYLGEGDTVEYREGIFVGYRYYDKKKMPVLFPFGYGLSYTTFAYSNLRLSADKLKDTEELAVSVDITNTGKVAGKEVVQLYVADIESTVLRPQKELRDFIKLELAPGETKTTRFILGKRAFAYWSTKLHDWHVESGEFEIMIGRSSADIVLKRKVDVISTVKLPVIYTLDTILSDIMEDKEAMERLLPLIKLDLFEEAPAGENASAGVITKEMREAMMKYMPVRAVVSFGGKCTLAELEEVLKELNERD